MGIGVTFEEAFQKALRMVNSDWNGFCYGQEEVSDEVSYREQLVSCRTSVGMD